MSNNRKQINNKLSDTKNSEKGIIKLNGQRIIQPPPKTILRPDNLKQPEGVTGRYWVVNIHSSMN